MKFADRLKTDKKFRWKAILIFIVAVLVIGNYQGDMKKEAPSQATCDNSNNFGILTNIDTCINVGCGVVAPDYKFGLDLLECTQSFAGGVALYCSNNPSAQPIKTFLAKTEAKADDLCGVGNEAKDAGVEFCGRTLYTCVEIPEEDQYQNEFQRTAGSFMDSFDFTEDWSPKMKYYAVTFGGGFLALVIIMAAL